MRLRPYQHDWINRIRDAYRAGHRRVLAQSPTGSGKTVAFAYLSAKIAAAGQAVLILVHRRELTSQAHAKIPAAGIIAAGYTPTPGPVQIASVQSLIRRQHPPADYVIVDEAHHATAGTYRAILDRYPDARVLGVTATPCRTSGAGLGDVFTDMVTGPTVADLTAAGWLAPAVVYAPAGIDTDGVPRRGGDYAAGALAIRADRPHITGSAVEYYRRLADGEPAIAFCVSRAHAVHVAAQFTNAGYRAAPVDGDTPTVERDRLIAGLATGDVQVLTSCDLISEGVDVPVVSVGLMLRPTESLALWLQQCGRILRPAGGKTRALILDHAGNTARHGLPDEPREWTLDAHRAVRGGETPPPVRQCPACFYAHRPAPTCPACGWDYRPAERLIAERAGELERVAVARKRAAGMARTREQLEAVARERGYKQGWVHMMLRARG